MPNEIDPQEVIRKCEQGEDLTYEEYCVGCERTLSDKFYDRYSIDLALTVLREFITAGNRLDQLKKALFYGKDLESRARQHKAELGFDGEELQVFPWATKVDPKLIHAIIGMATEDVELVENLYDALLNYKELDMVNLMEETGDHSWYQTIIFQLAKLKLGIQPTLQPMWRTILLKLNLRFPEKFTTDKAINRDTVAERALLEQQLTNV